MRERNGIQNFFWWLTSVIVVIAAAWFMIFSFFRQVSISGHSMEPTLSAGELVLVDTLQYKFFAPKRGDVVVFRRADGTENVKRVVGLPGEIVVIQNGRIYINGSLLDRGREADIALPGVAENPVELKEGEYFLIGDNADSSEDSRFENVGNVRQEQIIGKVWLRILPIRRFGWIG